jgi:hypothetical protein
MICVANRGRDSTDTVRLARPRNAAPHSGAVCYVEGICRSVNRFRPVLNCSLPERRTVTQLFSPVSGEHGSDALPALGPFVYADAVKAVGPLVGYPPDLQDAAVQKVLQQAEALSADWAA